MTLRDAMKYIESEYRIINSTPCQMCGGEFIAEDLDLEMIDGVPYDICDCVCSSCGYEKTFEFTAPFTINEKEIKHIKKILN